MRLRSAIAVNHKAYREYGLRTRRIQEQKENLRLGRRIESSNLFKKLSRMQRSRGPAVSESGDSAQMGMDSWYQRGRRKRI
ncbi:hypothetical protein [Azospirillum argentinense]